MRLQILGYYMGYLHGNRLGENGSEVSEPVRAGRRYYTPQQRTSSS